MVRKVGGISFRVGGTGRVLVILCIAEGRVFRYRDCWSDIVKGRWCGYGGRRIWGEEDKVDFFRLFLFF